MKQTCTYNFSGVGITQADLGEAGEFGRGVGESLGWSFRKPLILRV